MITVIATIRIKEGEGATFEKEFAAYAAQALKEEPYIELYRLTRSRSEPNTYRVLEIYRSQEDVDRHTTYLQKTAHINNMGRLFAAPPQLEHLDCVT
jgi:quinol monooxygenase YgiN